ncbi:MAG TPA: MEDS domain-containing protein [Chitinophagaceae bacterium]|nr:MEDS domain-containing protein [Chitinophagaceae bacterium]
MNNNNHGDWNGCKADIFWGEIAPCDHILQIYENDEVFLEALTGFVGGGINAGDSCIVIATEVHLKALESMLQRCGIHIESLIADNRLIPLDAHETLAKFMVNGWPDERLFEQTISAVLRKAHGPYNRRIRAFGEMVAILWAEGNYGATINLEHLWNKFCEKESFCLFCAYPKIGFTENMSDSINHICHSHDKLISGSEKQLTEVLYKESGQRRAI